MRKIIILGLILSSVSVSASGLNEDAYSWYGLIPALIAIVISILTRQVILSLVLAVVSGSVIFYLFNPSDSYLFGIDKAIDHYILDSIVDSGHASVILFSLLVAGMINVINRMGAFNGLVNWLSKFATTKRSALLTTYFLGFIVFFDDYANTLVVGNTMQKITDKFKISREKLAFIVDATAAPIASIALVSTWIGYEVQLIDEGIANANIAARVGGGYSVFLNSISYSFYPIFILMFILILILTGKDFGPMKKFELEAQIKASEKSIQNEKSIAPIWAVLPIGILLFVTLFGIYSTGNKGEGVAQAIQNGDCYKGLIWGSSAALFVALIISSLNKNAFEDSINWILDGMKSLVPAIVILVLAWSLNGVLSDLKLGEFLSDFIVSTEMDFYLLPVIVFIFSGFIAFSTGSSFSTMGILFPIVISIASSFLSNEGEVSAIFYCSIASVLSGAVLGDHCSPISDTTILSSMATGCNHINHVNSQLIYCLVVGVLSIVIILLQGVFGIPFWILMIIGLLLIYLTINMLGEIVDTVSVKLVSLTKKKAH
ncbi:hypothetical protein N8089_01485 [Flavobacteriales bacterium]|nr:hypothetical protein [Flavobacteriales bacterium]